jgi:hypothetical protein
MEREDFEQKKQRTRNMTRVIYDFAMGILWTGVGIFLLFHNKLGIQINFDDLLGQIFGGSCILYGLFRVYRGYKSFQ